MVLKIGPQSPLPGSRPTPGPQGPQSLEFAGPIFQGSHFAQGVQGFQGPLAPWHAVPDQEQHPGDKDEHGKVPVHG